MENETFGTSTKKFSLNAIVGKPQPRVTTSEDINNLLGTMAKTSAQVEQIIEDKQSTELNKKYNDAQVQYHTDMTNAGDDLWAQTQAFDTFNKTTENLMKTPDITDKVRNRFSAVALNDIGRLRGRHDAIRSAYNKSLLYDGIATDAMTFKSLSKEDKAEWYKDKMELGTLYKLTPQETSEQIVSALDNVNRVNITADTPLEVIQSLQSDMESLQKLNPKLIGKDYYVKALNYLKNREESKKGQMEQLLVQRLAFGQDSKQDKLQLIKDSSWLSSDKKEAYKQLVNNREYQRVVQVSSNSFDAVRDNYNIDMTTVKSMGINRMLLDRNYTREQYENDIRIAEDRRQAHTDKVNKQLLKDIKAEAYNFISNLKSTGRYDEEPQIVATKLAIMTEGKISAENQSWFRRYQVGKEIQDTDFINNFDFYKANMGLEDTDTTWFQVEANKFINRRAPQAIQNGGEDLTILAGQMNVTRQVGNVPTMITQLFEKPNINTAEGVQALQSNVQKVQQLISSSPQLASKLLGKNEQKFYMLSASMLTQSENGMLLTKDEVDKVNDILANPKAYKLDTDIDEIFNKKYNHIGQTAYQQFKDLEMYKNLRRFGMSGSEAISTINDRYKIATGDNYSLVGIDPENPKYSSLSKDFTQFAREVKDPNSFYTIDPTTNEVWIGTKTMPSMRSTGIKLESYTDPVTGQFTLGLMDAMAYLREKDTITKDKEFRKTPLGRTTTQIEDAWERHVNTPFKTGVRNVINNIEQTKNMVIRSAEGYLIFARWFNDKMHNRDTSWIEKE